MTGRSAAGFTLVEVMVVVLVVGLMAAAAAPRLDALLEPGPRAAADELADAYRRARELAVERASVATVTVDPRTGAWRVFDDPEGGRGRPVAGGNLLTDRPDTRITGGDAPLAVVRFDARGRARAPDLTIRGPSTLHRVTVDAWTGSIRIR